MYPVSRVLRFFFYHLYHGFAWAYDLVSKTVSFGRWNHWTSAVIPFIQGQRLLELGHGPGHLQEHLRWDLKMFAVGLDESTQMGRLAAARLHRSGRIEIQLIRGLAQNLPFRSETFDTIVSTFPSAYIIDPRTLSEVQRTLVDGGRLIVLPVAWPNNWLLGWLFRLTGESPSGALEIAITKLKQPFEQAGFEVEVRSLDVRSGRLLIVLAAKSMR